MIYVYLSLSLYIYIYVYTYVCEDFGEAAKRAPASAVARAAKAALEADSISYYIMVCYISLEYII